MEVVAVHTRGALVRVKRLGRAVALGDQGAGSVSVEESVGTLLASVGSALVNVAVRDGVGQAIRPLLVEADFTGETGVRRFAVGGAIGHTQRSADSRGQEGAFGTRGAFVEFLVPGFAVEGASRETQFGGGQVEAFQAVDAIVCKWILRLAVQDRVGFAGVQLICSTIVLGSIVEEHVVGFTALDARVGVRVEDRAVLDGPWQTVSLTTHVELGVADEASIPGVVPDLALIMGRKHAGTRLRVEEEPVETSQAPVHLGVVVFTVPGSVGMAFSIFNIAVFLARQTPVVVRGVVLAVDDSTGHAVDALQVVHVFTVNAMGLVTGNGLAVGELGRDTVAVSQDEVGLTSIALYAVLVVSEASTYFGKEALVAASAFVQIVPGEAGGALASTRVPRLASLRKRGHGETLPTNKFVVLDTGHAHPPLSSTSENAVVEGLHHTLIAVESVAVFASHAVISVTVVIEAIIHFGVGSASEGARQIKAGVADQALVGEGTLLVAVGDGIAVGVCAGSLIHVEVLGRVRTQEALAGDRVPDGAVEDGLAGVEVVVHFGQDRHVTTLGALGLVVRGPLAIGEQGVFHDVHADVLEILQVGVLGELCGGGKVTVSSGDSHE